MDYNGLAVMVANDAEEELPLSEYVVGGERGNESVRKFVAE